MATITWAVMSCSSGGDGDPESARIEIGTAATTVSFSEDGCTSAGMSIETETGIRAIIEPGACLATRDGQPLSGDWTLGLEASDVSGEIDQAEVERVGAIRVYAQPLGEARVALTGPVRLLVDLANYRQSGAWFQYAFLGDPLGELASPAGSAGRATLISAIPLRRDMPSELNLDGTGTVALGWMAPAAQKRGLVSKQSTASSTVTVSSSVDAAFDGFPDLCLWTLTNIDTAEIVFASDGFGWIGEGDSVTDDNPHGRFVTRLLGGAPRRIEMASPFSNVFRLRYVMCDGPSDSLAPEDAAMEMTGGSEREADVDARYVGRVEVRFRGTAGDFSDEVRDPLNEINDRLPAGSVARVVRFGRPDATTFVSDIEVSGYDRSTRRLAELLPDDWVMTPGNRTLQARRLAPEVEVEFPSQVQSGRAETLVVRVARDDVPIRGARVEIEAVGATPATTRRTTDEDGRVTAMLEPEPDFERVELSITVASPGGVEWARLQATADVSPPSSVEITAWTQQAEGNTSVGGPGLDNDDSQYDLFEEYYPPEGIRTADPGTVMDEVTAAASGTMPTAMGTATAGSTSVLAIGEQRFPTLVARAMLNAQAEMSVAASAPPDERVSYRANAEPTAETALRFEVPEGGAAYTLARTLATTEGSSARMTLRRDGSQTIEEDRHGEGTGDSRTTSGLLEPGEYLLVTEVSGIAFTTGLDEGSSTTSAVAEAELTLTP